jgi:hypothetical protein
MSCIKLKTSDLNTDLIRHLSQKYLVIVEKSDESIIIKLYDRLY